ncbi:hypothetical protein ACHAXA_010985 [Cyclostephanos tholiformis]|uniref:protein disulfide-isomerase n=1 Tax=Cyclostephanos tholiformis TaxID=382380 RepID=A0ABD3RR02_9STRA
MSLLVPLTQATRRCLAPLSMAGTIRNLLIWMLMATAASSRLVPAVIATGDVDEWPENDDVVDHGSTVTGTSSFEYISITDDYENEGDDTVEDETDASGNVDEDEDEVTEDSDLGLQIWPNVDALLRHLEGGRLVLVVILAPWCDRGQNSMRETAALAAGMLDETLVPPVWPSRELHPDGLPLSELWDKPCIGIMDSFSTSDDWRMEIFGNVTHYPALKFVMTSPISSLGQTQTFLRRNREDEALSVDGVPDEEAGDDDIDSHVQIWDFIGPRVTATDLYDSVMMNWYRTFLSHNLGEYVEPSKNDPNNARKLKPPYFTFSSQQNLTTFLQYHGNHILRPAKARRRHLSKLESEVFNYFMGVDEGSDDVGGIYRPFELFDDDNAKGDNHLDGRKAFTREIDPYVLVVQCRARINNHGNIGQLKAMNDFDDLAEKMVHRSDVAFFALDATNYDKRNTDNSEKVCGGLFGNITGPLIGAVVFVRIRRHVDYSVIDEPENGHLEEQSRQKLQLTHNIRTEWDEINNPVPREIFVPATVKDMPMETKEIYGKTAVKDPMIPIEYVRTNLVASTILHVTPTVIWFDKERMSQLAFPWYRKVHAVLFVDMGLAHKISRPSSNNRSSWPSSLDYSEESRKLLRSQRFAIRMFYQSALRHRRHRSSDDVVFLIVPSSEVRIMTAFGIDIWTPLDEALFGTSYEDGSNGVGEKSDQRNSSRDGYCSSPFNVESRSILPMMMITDSSGRSGMQSSRYYLCSDDIVSFRTTNEDGGVMAEFIDKFFNRTIGRPFVRSDTPQPSSGSNVQGMGIANRPNVTVLTGNTFESLVMDRNHEHTMLLMQSTSCGHCKRFSIFWNELASLVQALNWSSVISVMKIDVTKNDVPHSKVNAWDVPSVYYFPANQKDEPIELPTPTLPNSNPQHSYDEGLSWVTSGYDLVRWMIDQGKLDIDLLYRLDGSSADGDTAEKN